MKILSTIHELKNMISLSVFVDGFLVGNDSFGTRLTKSFEIPELMDAIHESKRLNKEIFLLFNQIMNDEEISKFIDFIKSLPLHEVTGIVVADLGVLMVLKAMGYAQKVIYHPETLITNTYDFNMMIELGIKGVVVAKEITLDEIKEIGDNRKLELFMVGHGHLNMFYSKRQLIENFMDHLGEKNRDHNRHDLRLIEENRASEAFPILEDHAGTHVFRSNVMHSIDHLSELNTCVDYIIVDTIFKDDAYAEKVLPMYHTQMLDLEVKHELESLYHEQWDEGFFYKKTIYKTKG